MTTRDDVAAGGGTAHPGARRGELVGALERYLEALSANDPVLLGTDSIRFTENGQELAVGKGLWGTATRQPAPEVRLALADERSSQAACFALVGEADEPVLLALRVRLNAGRIAEAETLVCRDRDSIFSVEGFRRSRPLFEQLVSEEQRDDRELLAGIPDRYFDGILAGDGSAIPVAPDCIRVENGVQTVLNPELVGIREAVRDRGTWHLSVAKQVDSGIFSDIEAARDRRVPLIDEDLGVAFAWFLFDHAGPLTSRGGESRFRTPNSMMAAEAFKVVGGQIREIEALLGVFPYGMRPGWT